MQGWIYFAILALAGYGAFGVMGYTTYAERRMWPVGGWFSDSTSLLNILAMLTLPFVLLVGGLTYSWIAAIGALVLGTILVAVTVPVIGPKIQPLLILALIAGWAGTLIYASDVSRWQ